jgi:protein-tyrosine phosphatase
MAEGILKALLEKEGICTIRVESAGTHAPEGMHPTQNAILTSIEHGITIADHRARVLTSEMVHDADILFVMEESHRLFINHYFPEGKNKVHLLKAFGAAGRSGEVKDPIGGDLTIYRSCFEELEVEIKRILPEIIEIVHE